MANNSENSIKVSPDQRVTPQTQEEADDLNTVYSHEHEVRERCYRDCEKKTRQRIKRENVSPSKFLRRYFIRTLDDLDQE
ncbi:hypothetical protein [Photobacterium kishitanii]|uniref:Uncharacterized protein n=1 Tax=Photobacterium kishitanii TaxID=318456 RepID=A0A2T3KLI7_9GAMM|nr:hypothetical protein [Photobacterium kishitanii]PSV00551.1 hypothetical protein C9J27_05295 [Photobacterium kishitanii]